MATVHRVARPAADVKAATIVAMTRGKAVPHAPDYWTADYAGKCASDLIVEQAGYGHLRCGTKGEPEVWEPARTLSIKVPCRKCGPCRKARRMLWTDRAVREYRASTRTWIVTLTFRPEERYKLSLRAEARYRDTGGDFNGLSIRDRFTELLREYQREIDLFLMRLRKGLTHRKWELIRFRYLLVAERHADGTPHFHALIHEIDECMPVRKARIEEAWGKGFVHARIIKDEAAARYVVKYLGKQDFQGRVRASKRYGEVPELLPDAVAMPGRAGVAPPQPLADDQAVARQRFRLMREDLGDVPGERLSELRDGDDIAVCELGLHVGVACECGRASGPEQRLRADDPTVEDELLAELREWRARERNQPKGWTRPMPRLAHLVVQEANGRDQDPPDKSGAVEPGGELAQPPDPDDEPDTGWVDPDDDVQSPWCLNRRRSSP